jgi:hypothetical protein
MRTINEKTKAIAAQQTPEVLLTRTVGSPPGKS